MKKQGDTRMLRPQEGPQEQFLACSADVVLYGGAAGGGKTFALLLECVRFSGVKNFNAVIFRRTYPEIIRPGGIWDVGQELLGGLGAKANETKVTWKWPSGARVVCSHLQHESDKYAWQGAQVPLFCFDELTHFSESQFFYMLSRNRSTCGVRPYIRATCNPDPDSWVRAFISWWIGADGLPIPERAGVVRYFKRVDNVVEWYDERVDDDCISFTFIPALLSDNKILVQADPKYAANLRALAKHEREKLLAGNWDARPQAGEYFKREFFRIIEASEASGSVVRYWDRAATEPSETNKNPDWTCGVKLRRTREGLYIIEDVRRFRLRPDGVRKAIRATAEQDGSSCVVWLSQDPGQAGVVELQDLRKYLDGFSVKSEIERGSKVERANPVSAQAEAGNICLVRGPWNAALLSELESFPPRKEGGEISKAKKDQVDALCGAWRAHQGPRIGIASV